MSGERASQVGAGPAQWVTPVLGLCVLVGVAALAYGFFGTGQPLFGWQALNVAFLYIVGPTFAGILISAIYELTDSRWGQNVKRLAESSIGLVPVALLGFVGALLGHHHLLEAGHHGHELFGGKVTWLDPTFLPIRDGILVVVLSLVSIFFVKLALRPALGAAIQQGAPIKANPLAAWITAGYRGYEQELPRCKRRRQVLAPILVILYALSLTIIAFDFIMALDPIFISTLFGAYFFITSLFMAWALLSVAAALTRQQVGSGPFAAYGRRIETDDLHSLGKLLFAFCMLSADFFWSQFVVIWYANIPEETPFVIRRVRLEPWNDVALAVLLVGYALPFVLLVFKRLKRTPVTLMGISLLILFMMWVERTLLVAPSLWHDPTGPSSTGHDGGQGAAQALEHVVEGAGQPLAATLLIGLGVVLGFVGLGGFCYRYVVNVFIHAAPEKDLDERGHLLEGDGGADHQGPPAEGARAEAEEPEEREGAEEREEAEEREVAEGREEADDE